MQPWHKIYLSFNGEKGHIHLLLKFIENKWKIKFFPVSIDGWDFENGKVLMKGTLCDYFQGKQYPKGRVKKIK